MQKTFAVLGSLLTCLHRGRGAAAALTADSAPGAENPVGKPVCLWVCGSAAIEPESSSRRYLGDGGKPGKRAEPDVSHLDNNFAPGDVVAGLEASELVEIQRLAPFGGKTLVEGVGLQSRRTLRRPLTADELAALIKIPGQQRTFNGSDRLFLRGAEAEPSVP